MSLQQAMLMGGGALTLRQAIVTAGLTTNLQLCLDAGDEVSWPGSGLKWIDRSGNGYDFFLGTDGTTNAPTFTGTVGNLGAYWVSDGTNFFRYDTTNETWMQNMHKDNAAFTMMAFLYDPATGALTWGDSGNNAGNVGVQGNMPAAGYLVRNAGANALNVTGATLPTDSAWNMYALSLLETGTSFMYVNGAYSQVGGSDTFSGVYTSPSAANATYTMEIGAYGNAQAPMGNGTRISCIAFWSTNLSKANMDRLWSLMRFRFGL